MISLIQRLGRAPQFVKRMKSIRRTWNETDADQLLTFFEPPSFGSIFKWLQMREEIKELYARVRKLQPRVVVEIGTNNGGTLFMLTRAASSDATLVSIDLPGGSFGGGYSLLRSIYFWQFASSGQQIRLIRQNSHSPDAFNRLGTILGQRSIDFLFIDGDHNYEGVKQDFDMYGALVRPGGLIAFHDVLPAPKEIAGGVPDFWLEISELYQGQIIAEDLNQNKMGIGVICVPETEIRFKHN